MGNELAIYQRAPEALSLMREAGTVLAKSRMFGCETVEQGMALQLISMTEGLPLLELRRRYHVIGGELTMRADYMRAEFRRLGGEYWWLNTGEKGDKAVMRVKYLTNDLEVEYSIDDSKREGVWKKGSRWEKAPGDMLRARVSTKAIRIVCSEVLAGFATDEELAASEGKSVAEVIGSIDASFTAAPAANGNGKSAAAVPTPAAPAPQQPATASTPGEIIDAEYEVKPDAKPGPDAVQAKAAADAATARATAAAASTTYTGPISGGPMCSSDQQKTIRSLWQQLGATPEQTAGQLAKRNVKELWQLTVAEANELIGKLNAVAAKEQAEAIVGQSKADPAATTAYTWEPIRQALRDEIIGIIKELPQPERKEVASKLIQNLNAGGYQQVADLSQRDGERLRNALIIRNMEAFFGGKLDARPAVAATPPS
jgi:hypothetical protein